MYSTNRQTETTRWGGRKHPVAEGAREMCISLFYLFIIQPSVLCCLNLADDCEHLHKSPPVESPRRADHAKTCTIWAPRELSSPDITRLKTPQRLDIDLCLWTLSLCQWISLFNKIGRILEMEIDTGHIHLKHKSNSMPPTYNTSPPKTSHQTSNKKFCQYASYGSNAHCLHKSLLLTRKWLLMRTCSFLASGLKRHRS